MLAGVPGLQLGRDTAYNLGGSLVPVVVSLITVPLYLRYMGVADYGVLAIAWVILGYFGLFNLNFDRVATHFIARQDPAQHHDRLFWTLLLASLVAGCIGGGLLLGGYPLLRLIQPSWIRAWGGARTASVVVWLALAVPVTTVSTTLQGALDGARAFLLNNSLKLAGSTLLQIAPLLAAIRHGHQLAIVVGVAVCAKAAVIPFFLLAAMRKLRTAMPCAPDLTILREGLSFGGWFSLQSSLYQIGTTIDQLLIGAVLGPAAVTYYSVPYRFTSRISVLPGALTGALFPRLSATTDASAERMARKANMVLAGASLAVITLAMLAANSFFRAWLGERMAAPMLPLAVVLLLGAWLNGVAYIPSNLLVTRGRVKLGAAIHAANTAAFLIALWFLLQAWGVEGAAWAWAFRAVCGLVGFSLPFTTLLRVLALILPVGAGLAALALSIIHRPGAGGLVGAALAIILLACAAGLARAGLGQRAAPATTVAPAPSLS